MKPLKRPMKGLKWKPPELRGWGESLVLKSFSAWKHHQMICAMLWPKETEPGPQADYFSRPAIIDVEDDFANRYKGVEGISEMITLAEKRLCGY